MKRFVFAAAMILMLAPATAWAQLYSEDFEVDPTLDWTVNDGPTDEYAEFHYDYSTIGIPSAPNSSGGSTHGMRLRANLIGGVFGGFTVSPTGQSFTGDYRLTFDLWHNYIGERDGNGVNPIGTTSGSTMLSMFGIETSGTTANYPGAVDSIFFAHTGDVSSAAFRAYAPERAISYQFPIPTDPPPPLDGQGNPIDGHATYHANTRSNNPATGGGNEVYYQNAFPSVTVPAAQTAIYPETQSGMTQPGSVGFDWREVVIEKIGNTVTWTMDDTLLITLDTEHFVTPTAGTNILFGHSDINAAVSADPYYLEVAFTLIDNINIEEIAAGLLGDFNEDNKVDAADYVTWQKSGSGTLPNDGGAADQAARYDVWRTNFGGMSMGSGGGAAIPEPGTCALALVAMLVAGFGRRRPV